MDPREELWIEQKRLVDQVVERLRDAIVSGRFRPGERIRQEQVAQQMGISRTPLRMALSVLTSQGLLHRTGARRLTVPEFTYQEAMDLYLLREVVLGLACRLAAERVSDRQLERLGTVMSDTEKFVVAEDWPGWLRANEDFSTLIGEAAGIGLLSNFLDAICVQAQVFRSTLLALPVGSAAPVGQAAHEHRAIYEAIRARDPERAERAARDHVRGARARYQDACQLRERYEAGELAEAG
jgi:DNA-binding GntR family transcriptional regulator